MTLCQTRRIFFSGLLFIIAACSDRSFADDWPGFQGADRDGVVHDTAVLTDWPEGGPAERWARDIGPGFGGAAIKDGRVYLLDRDGIAGDVLRVFDLETGRSLWSAGYDAPGRISYHGSRSTPMVTDTHAYTVGSFGQVTAFDLERQCVAWQHHMDDFGADPPKWAWSQSPLIVQGSVVVAPMASEAGLVALDPETGNVRWRSPDIGREGYGSPRLMPLLGKTHIVTYTSTRLTGVDPADGRVLWSYEGVPVKRAIPTPAHLGGDRIFVTAGYDSGSALIELRTLGDTVVAKEIKRDKTHGGQIHSPLLVGEHLYVNLNTNENLRRGPTPGIGCFDRNGNLLWTHDTPGLDRGTVLAVGGYLLTLGGEDGVLRLIKPDPAGYDERAAAKIFETNAKRNMIWAPMAFADGLLVLRSQSQLKCLDLRPGKGVDAKP